MLDMTVNHKPLTYQDKEVRSAVLSVWFYSCAYCGHPASTVDHIIPSCSGGSDKPSNLVAACSLCNSRKDKNIIIDEFNENFLSTAEQLSPYVLLLAQAMRSMRKEAIDRRRNARKISNGYNDINRFWDALYKCKLIVRKSPINSDPEGG